jgi:hypothetical protein
MYLAIIPDRVSNPLDVDRSLRTYELQAICEILATRIPLLLQYTNYGNMKCGHSSQETANVNTPTNPATAESGLADNNSLQYSHHEVCMYTMTNDEHL